MQLLYKGKPVALPVECGGSMPEDMVTVTVLSNNETFGTVKGGGVVQKGMAIMIEATPDYANGLAFTNWSVNDEVVSTSLRYTFTPTEDITLTATFEPLYNFGKSWVTMELSAGSYGISNGVLFPSYRYLGYNQVDGYTYVLLVPTSGSCGRLKLDNNDPARIVSGGSTNISPYGNISIDDNGDIYYCYDGYLYKCPIDGGVWSNRNTHVKLNEEQFPEYDTYHWNMVAYHDGKWVVAASNFAQSIILYVLTSSDGNQWEKVKIYVSTGAAYYCTLNLIYAAGSFIMSYYMAADNNPSTNLYYPSAASSTRYSADGLHWMSASNVGSHYKLKPYEDDKVVVLTSGNNGIKVYAQGNFSAPVESTTGLKAPRFWIHVNGLHIAGPDPKLNSTSTYTFFYGKTISEMAPSDPVTNSLWTEAPIEMFPMVSQDGKSLSVFSTGSKLVYVTKLNQLEEETS